MSRLFADDTDEEIKSSQGCFTLIVGFAFFVLIPIAGFFYFVWEPLGKGLLFVAVFTALWSVPLSYFASKEIEKRKSKKTDEILAKSIKLLEKKKDDK